MFLPDHHGYFRKRGPQRLAAGKLKVPKAVENRYALKLRRIIKQIHKEILKHEHFRQDAGKETLDEYLARINKAAREPVGRAFDEMVIAVKRANKAALISINPSDLRLGAKLQQLRDYNIALMENAGRVYADQVRQVMQDPANVGARVEDLAAQIAERGDVSESKAEFIARDQTLKMNGQINQIRQENAGISQYTWSTSHDERVRPEHAELDGQVFDWSAPPEPGHPGEDFQCRCIAIPFFGDDSE